MPEQLIKTESLKNGVVLGAILGAVLIWGQYIRDPILGMINGIIPTTSQFGGFSAIVIVIGVCAVIGYIIDKT